MISAIRGSLIPMGTLIYGFNVSVDGYIADAHGNIDWSAPSDELHQYWNDFERKLLNCRNPAGRDSSHNTGCPNTMRKC